MAALVSLTLHDEHTVTGWGLEHAQLELPTPNSDAGSDTYSALRQCHVILMMTQTKTDPNEDDIQERTPMTPRTLITPRGSQGGEAPRVINVQWAHPAPSPKTFRDKAEFNN